MISFMNINLMEEISRVTGYSLTNIITRILKHEDEDGDFVFSGNKYEYNFWGNAEKIGRYKISYSSENGNIIIKSIKVELDDI